MAYTTTELITRAYYLSQVVSRDLQQVSGDQIGDGLVWLNALLSLKSAYSRVIPYYTLYEFNTVVGQEVYFVPNLVQPETLTFNQGVVRYATQNQSRKAYQGSGRVDGITSLMFDWNFERCLGGANISFYFFPNAIYPVKIWGKFGFDNVTLSEDLLSIFDEYYIDYLRYKLARRICSEYGIEMAPQALKELEELEEAVTDVSPPDLTMTKISSFRGRTGFNWGDVNTGKGWRPGN